MGKLYITRGLPASGKSTWAEEVRAADPDNVRVVTMDDIREAIGSSFEQGDEPIVQSIRDFTIRKYLERGYTVISADTNLPERVVRHLTGVAESAGVGYVVIQDFRDVDVNLCLERNANRERVVPGEVILSMYERFIKNLSRS